MNANCYYIVFNYTNRINEYTGCPQLYVGNCNILSLKVPI